VLVTTKNITLFGTVNVGKVRCIKCFWCRDCTVFFCASVHKLDLFLCKQLFMCFFTDDLFIPAVLLQQLICNFVCVSSVSL